jgi:Flp pilus assembly protein TadD
MVHPSIARCLIMFALCASAVAQEAPRITSDAEHDSIYQKAVALISPHMQLLDRSPRIDESAQKDLRQGIAYLHAVTEYNPRNWAAFWIEGKAYQALSEPEPANRAFATAYTLQPRNADVAREYAQSSMELGHGQDAIDATNHAIELAPNDAGLRANLALAYVIAGRNQDALRAVNESLNMNPNDAISRRLKTVIEDVIAGRRPQPKTVAELER